MKKACFYYKLFFLGWVYAKKSCFHYKLFFLGWVYTKNLVSTTNFSFLAGYIQKNLVLVIKKTCSLGSLTRIFFIAENSREKCVWCNNFFIHIPSQQHIFPVTTHISFIHPTVNIIVKKKPAFFDSPKLAIISLHPLKPPLFFEITESSI